MSDAMDEKVDTNDKDTTESISKSICGDITLLSKLKGQQRSQSTIQLLGYINAFEDEEEKDQDEGDTIVQKKNDVNDDIALKKRGYDTLVNTCTSLLSCIQILRRIIREYAYGRMGKELQHLSLTVASFERVLYTFIKEEVLIVSNEFAKRPPIDFRSKNALKDIIPLISKNERHNILIGGTAALLRHATKSLEETKQVLEDLQTGYDPNWEKRWSFSSLMITFISFFLYKKWKKSINLKFFLKNLMPTQKNIQFGFFICICIDLWQRFHYRFSNLRRVKVHHARVLMALRLFLLCQYVVQRARQQGVSPDRRLLIDIPTESDIDDDKKNATTLLIERVPLPSEYYDCSSEPMGLTLFKKGIQVFLASSALANTLLGRYKRLYKIFGPVFVVGAIPFYALRHQKAARISTRLLLDDPNVNVIRMAWDVWGESTLSKFVMKLQAPKIPVRKWIYLRLNSNGTEVITSSSRRQLKSDIGLQIFSARPLNSVLQGTWEEASVRLSAEMIAIGLPAKKHVLFYIHGGGFFGRFHSKDIFNLSQWATKLGVVIVYIDYSLAPEVHYPDSLQQCMTAYKWVLNGGLGFLPDRIGFFGESAGGNLATALCLKSTLENVKKPNGLVLMFPALTLHLSSSPSRFLHQHDPVLPRGIVELALNSYYPSHGSSHQYRDNIHDPLVAPGVADDALLSKLPHVSIVVGDLDPLLDDSIDFYTRLNHIKVPASLKIYSGLTHGFLIYGDLVPEAQHAIDDTCEKCRLMFLPPPVSLQQNPALLSSSSS